MKQKKPPRKQMLRVLLEVGVPRADQNIDILSAEQHVMITTDTMPSKIMKEIKPMLIEILKKAREHEPTAIVQPQKPKLILPE